MFSPVRSHAERQQPSAYIRVIVVHVPEPALKNYAKNANRSFTLGFYRFVPRMLTLIPFEPFYFFKFIVGFLTIPSQNVYILSKFPIQTKLRYNPGQMIGSGLLVKFLGSRDMNFGWPGYRMQFILSLWRSWKYFKSIYIYIHICI